MITKLDLHIKVIRDLRKKNSVLRFAVEELEVMIEKNDGCIEYLNNIIKNPPKDLSEAI